MSVYRHASKNLMEEPEINTRMQNALDAVKLIDLPLVQQYIKDEKENLHTRED